MKLFKKKNPPKDTVKINRIKVYCADCEYSFENMWDGWLCQREELASSPIKPLSKCISNNKNNDCKYYEED